MTVIIRIQARNNSDARNFSVLGNLGKAKHNGGKTVIATVDSSDLAAVEAILESSHAVAGYEVQS